MSMTPSTEPLVPKLKKDMMESLLKKGVRLDGRKLLDYREIKLETNYIPKAEGSALACVGDTMVLAGVKLEVGTPFPDTPDEGVLAVHAEFVPLASPSFEPGPPDENAIELARVIDRSLRELKVIDLGKLVIKPGEKVWMVWLDIYALDHGGNLIDASMLASMAALLSAKMPKAYVDPETGRVVVDKTERVGRLPITRKVVTVTIGKIGDMLLVDPSLDEENVLDAKLTIAVSDDGRIAGMQKAGMGAFTVSEVERAVNIALSKASELHKILEESIKEQ